MIYPHGNGSHQDGAGNFGGVSSVQVSRGGSRTLWYLLLVLLVTWTLIFVGIGMVMLSGIAGVLGRATLETTERIAPETRLIVIPGPTAVQSQSRYQLLTEIVEQPLPSTASLDVSVEQLSPPPQHEPIEEPLDTEMAQRIEAIVERFATAQPPAVAPSPREITVASYRDLFGIVATEFGLDWRLLAAMAYRESRLDPLAVGKDGDMGLMQILPSTWAEFAPAFGEVDPAAPFIPYSNVRIGAAYVVYLTDLLSSVGKNQVHWVLLAYNWGPNNVLRLHREGGTWADVPELRRRYVTDILESAYGFSPQELE